MGCESSFDLRGLLNATETNEIDKLLDAYLARYKQIFRVFIEESGKSYRFTTLLQEAVYNSKLQLVKKIISTDTEKLGFKGEFKNSSVKKLVNQSSIYISPGRNIGKFIDTTYILPDNVSVTTPLMTAWKIFNEDKSNHGAKEILDLMLKAASVENPDDPPLYRSRFEYTKRSADYNQLSTIYTGFQSDAYNGILKLSTDPTPTFSAPDTDDKTYVIVDWGGRAGNYKFYPDYAETKLVRRNGSTNFSGENFEEKRTKYKITPEGKNEITEFFRSQCQGCGKNKKAGG